MADSKNSPIKIIDYRKFYVGTVWDTKKSGKLIIEEYYDRFHVKVRFLDTDSYRIANLDNIKKGSVKDNLETFYEDELPTYSFKQLNYSPAKENNKELYEGKVFETRTSGPLIIEEYIDSKNVKIRFLNTGFRKTVYLQNILENSVKDPYCTTKFGGYVGEGDIVPRQNIKVRTAWEQMLRRANVHEVGPTYKNCSVDESWLNFQNFANWYINYRDKLNPDFYDELNIDKDLFQWGNEYKIYSPSTCCLIPAKINVVLSSIYERKTKIDDYLPIGVAKSKNGKFEVNICTGGVEEKYENFDTPEEAFNKYKELKKNYIIDLANFYFSKNAITPDVYEKLIDLNLFLED